ncbi:predicted protein [Chaetomium globosum CBS 148.51]|uniref:Uncharacterized protein n=1 Tax=Chaetomium globosum (strain ATCC 6205 / CBS 148.51 / DSM 1962 / NBRC 6347 / NRRL 1970) TaxID=306901 RepID=Q2HE36_CHAGB|nr:uncharacterized protein CHGG_01518 [Chaetomium globosum CBS 148.51]EAQ93283.1 predicted protein [Chaetomium globosum CBS 148.51]
MEPGVEALLRSSYGPMALLRIPAEHLSEGGGEGWAAIDLPEGGKAVDSPSPVAYNKNRSDANACPRKISLRCCNLARPGLALGFRPLLRPFFFLPSQRRWNEPKLVMAGDSQPHPKSDPQSPFPPSRLGNGDRARGRTTMPWRAPKYFVWGMRQENESPPNKDMSFVLRTGYRESHLDPPSNRAKAFGKTYDYSRMQALLDQWKVLYPPLSQIEQGDRCSAVQA